MAFYSKKLSALRQRSSTYAKELWAITDAVRKWWHYLLRGVFTIRTDYYSLKNLLKQVIQTSEQQYFLTKLLRYSYNIVYRKGCENLAADALSRMPAEDDELGSAQLLALSCHQLPGWLETLAEENHTDRWLSQIRQQITDQVALIGFSITNGLIMFKQRYCLAPLSPLREAVLVEFHSSNLGGHTGYFRTLYRVRQHFHWKGMTRYIRDFVSQCRVCQQVKIAPTKP